MSAVLRACRRSCDLVVVDLPAGARRRRAARHWQCAALTAGRRAGRGARHRRRRARVRGRCAPSPTTSGWSSADRRRRGSRRTRSPRRSGCRWPASSARSRDSSSPPNAVIHPVGDRAARSRGCAPACSTSWPGGGRHERGHRRRRSSTRRWSTGSGRRSSPRVRTRHRLASPPRCAASSACSARPRCSRWSPCCDPSWPAPGCSSRSCGSRASPTSW